MTVEEIRLECLRLIFRHDRTAAANVEMARELERYVTEKSATASDIQPSKNQQKKSDKP